MTDKQWILYKIRTDDDHDSGWSQFRLWGDDFRDNEEVVWAAITHKPSDLKYASRRLQHNIKMVEYVLKRDWTYLKHLYPDVDVDTNILFNALKNGPKYLSRVENSEIKSNDELVYKLVQINGEALEGAAEVLKDNEMIVLEAIKTYPEAICYASDRFRENRNLILKAVKINGLVLVPLVRYYRYLKWQNDKEVVLEAVKQNPEVITETVIKDKEIALAAVKQNGLLLRDTNEFRQDFEVVLEAVKQNPKAIENAHVLNKEIALTVVKQDGLLLEKIYSKKIYANIELDKDLVIDNELDREVVLEAVKQNGNALEYASNNFKEDFEIVLTALESLSENVKNNKYRFQNVREVYLAAIKENPVYFKYASDAMRSNKKFIIDAIRQNSMVLNELKSDNIDIDIIKNAIITDLSCLKDLSGGIMVYLSNKENVLELVKCNGMALQYVDDKYKSDYDVVLEAVRQNGMSIAYAVDHLRWNQEIAMAAIKNNARAIQYTAYTLRKYKPFLLDIIEENKFILPYIDEDVRDYEFLLEVVKRNGMALDLLNDKLKKNKEIVLEAVKQNGLALAYAHPSLRKDYEVVSAAIENNPDASKYALKEFSHVQTMYNIQEVQALTIDQELEQVKSKNEKIGFLERFLRINKKNVIEEIHEEQIKEIFDKICTLPEGAIKYGLFQDYNELLQIYYSNKDKINNKNNSEISKVDFNEKYQSINNRLRYSETKMKEAEGVKTV